MCGSVISITLCLGGVFARLAFPSISANHLSPSTTNTQIFATVTPDLCSSLLSQSIHTLAVQRQIFILQKREIFSIGYFTHGIPLLIASNWESHVIYSSTTFGTIFVVANFANFRVHACDGCSSRQMGRKSRKMEEVASLFHHIASTCITNFCTKMWVLFTLSFFLIHCTSQLGTQGSHFVWHVYGAKSFCHFSLFQSVTCTIVVIIRHRYIEVVAFSHFVCLFLSVFTFLTRLSFSGLLSSGEVSLKLWIWALLVSAWTLQGEAFEVVFTAGSGHWQNRRPSFHKHCFYPRVRTPDLQ